MPELSYEQKRGFIMAAVDPQKEYKVWIKDVFEDKAIVEDNGRLFEVPYTIADGVAHVGARKEVITSYVPLAEIPEVEIFETGSYRGKTYTEDDLDTMVKNFDELKDKIKPTLVVGHSEDQKFMKDSGIPSAGWMTGVKRVGQKLVASFKDVPKLIAELVEKGAYKRISSEIYNNFDDKGIALRRVALMGGDIPEVKTLQDVAALYADTQETTWVVFDEGSQSSQKKEKEMPDKDITKLQEDMTKLSEKVTTLESENKALKADKEQAMTKLSEKETGERKAKALGIVKPMRDAGLAPAIAERMEKFAEGLDNSKVEKFGEKEHTLLDEFGSILDSIVKRDAKGRLFVPFGEQAPGAKGNEGKGSAADQLTVLTRQKMEANKVLNYSEAFAEVQRENPDLATEYSEDLQKK